jgi:glutamate synthase (NADPH/NADH) large chain
MATSSEGGEPAQAAGLPQTQLPEAQGLYSPEHEHDACGLGFVATLTREPSHAVVAMGLEVLASLTHRGAAGGDARTGDGAGVLLQLPHRLYAGAAGFRVPGPGDYGVAMCFLARDGAARARQEAALVAAVEAYGQGVLGWREVPLDAAQLGPTARASLPWVRQLFIERRCAPADFERTLYFIRRRAERAAAGVAGPRGQTLYVASCSSRTVVYKGLMLAEQVGAFYPDLTDARTASRVALVHSRFSTNTFPTWERAHPFRRLAHNGEINTLQGNRAWMRAREPLLGTHPGPLPGAGLPPSALEDVRPVLRPGGSDSESLDDAVDFLLAGGRSLPHVLMMLVPEALGPGAELSPELRAFYGYHASLMEPWDGPAALAFTDGQLVGAVLDRNGLRPARYAVTADGLVVLASEMGVLPLDPARVVEKGRVAPGRMFLVDTAAGRRVPDAELKQQLALRRPYQAWLAANRVPLASLPPPAALHVPPGQAELLRRQRAFGYSEEDVSLLLAPMAEGGEEAVGSMGVDVPLAVLSERPQSLFRYFKQQFAQVTNPPIDPLREAVVMSLAVLLGPRADVLAETPGHCRQVELPHPVLTEEDLARLEEGLPSDLPVVTLDTGFWPPQAGQAPGEALAAGLERLCREAGEAVDGGAALLVLSDRQALEGGGAPMPALLACAAVHHHLVRTGRRMKAGLVVETGEAREVHHVALLVGYGAGAVCPSLALQTAASLARRGLVQATPHQAQEHLVKALKKGLLKVMSKMGISTVASYQGAQIFEAVGLERALVERHFTGTHSRVGGVGLEELALDALARRASADALTGAPGERLEVGGHHHSRVQGERHLWSPQAVASLQKAVRLKDAESYAAYSRAIDAQNAEGMTLRGLWGLVPAGPPVPLGEVEGAESLVRRFATGAMSFGSLSAEAHENLALAMNRIGGRSNTGEGGEDPARFRPGPDGESRRSAIKQVASGRFGVTAHYLVNADELQIKMAQGAKPGEGGQLPGHKVDAVIARVRHSTPGVTLISPPPHHDIYSIEDLKQLIFDLRCVNPTARISVKLVSEAGVGTVAAGVAKAGADLVVVAGHDGGTGASPLTSIHHAGTPWELGLSEAQQVLVLNGLRGRVRLQVDGQLRTGRDVVVGALLGAEEFGFATAPLVASGCIMMRKCHLNTCPVGVATQDPALRARFPGRPEHVIHYLFQVAEEVRALLAGLGLRTLDEAVGRVECLAPRALPAGSRLSRLTFADVLHRPVPAGGGARVLRGAEGQSHDAGDTLDHTLLPVALPAIERAEPLRLFAAIRNRHRAFGAVLSGEVVRRHGAEGMAEDTLVVEAQGSAGQSFGAWAARGLTLVLEGEGNDYVGKGLSGGVLVVRPPREAHFLPEEQVVVGNTVLYGATSGKAFFNGRAGERFAVRNSGASAVVEGVGDHGCEYMTGGTVVVLGPTGRNFAAGMSGGVAYVLDEDGGFTGRCNTELVRLAPADEADASRVRALLEEHARRTGSPKAQRLLADWHWHHARFVRVSAPPPQVQSEPAPGQGAPEERRASHG